MENQIFAHIFGRKRTGDREEAKLLLFNKDGTPFVPGGGGAAAEGEAGQIGVLAGDGKIVGSPAIIQAPNGALTVQRDTLGDHTADYHGLKGGTGRILFGPTNMFIASQVVGGSITLNPGNNDYGASVIIREQSTAFLKPVELSSGDPTQPTHAATKQYVDNRVVQMTQAQYDALPVKNPTTLYVIV